MKRVKTVYLAGPMRGYETRNFPAFNEASTYLRSKCFLEVISPAEHDLEIGIDPNGEVPLQQDQEAFVWDFLQVIRADAVVVLPGWRDSEGATMEVAMATLMGRPVLEYPSLNPVEEEPVSLEAARLVVGPRQGSYGHPYDDFSRTGKMWAGVLRDWAIGVVDMEHVPDIPPHLVGLCQVALKISREVNAPKRDNLVDIAGYSETVNLVRQREAQRKRSA